LLRLKVEKAQAKKALLPLALTCPQQAPQKNMI